MIGKVKLLDCTLRDGGYYNEWDFDLDLVELYLNGLARAGIEYVEIGFRFLPGKNFLGPFAFTSEAFLKQISLPEGLQYGVMLNASDYIEADVEQLLRDHFVPASDSEISFVRVASHPGQVLDCAPLVSRLKALGYMVFLNVMQVGEIANDALITLVKDIDSQFVDFEGLYFADSLGNLRLDDIERIADVFKTHSRFEIGFHGHDNIGLGVANSVCAAKCGVTWIDATISGMGRGAGNTQTEYLAAEMSRTDLLDTKPAFLHQLATQEFAALQQKYGWGKNIYYYEAALHAVHPTYVQQMLASHKYTGIDILSMIAFLGDNGMGKTYRPKNLQTSFIGGFTDRSGESDVSNLCFGRPILLVAGGPNARKHWPAIQRFATQRNAFILAMNMSKFLDAKELDGVVCFHPSRLLSLIQNTTWSGLTLFTDKSVIPGQLSADLLQDRETYDYGIEVKEDTFEVRGNGCVIPAPLTAAASMALGMDMGASEVWVAGMDGYDGMGEDFREMQEILILIQRESDIPLYTLSKTYFDLPIKNIYG